jgi:hypothetical protein
VSGVTCFACRRAPAAGLQASPACDKATAGVRLGSKRRPGLFDTTRHIPDNARFLSEGFPSGQRGQTVNLLAQPSKVRILPPPPGYVCGHKGTRYSERGRPVRRGCSSMVEQKPSKLTTRVRFPSPAPYNVVSNPRPCSSVAEHSLGKGEVARSIRAMGTRNCAPTVIPYSPRHRADGFQGSCDMKEASLAGDIRGAAVAGHGRLSVVAPVI